MKHRILPGFTLSLGITLFYVCLIVVLPLGALLFKAASLGPDDYWRIVCSRLTKASSTAYNLKCVLPANIGEIT